MKFAICIILLAIGLHGQNPGARYLIITHDEFADAIRPLARWKHKKGMRTKTVLLSETGHTADSIRNYIIDAYNTWQIPPEFLLLVGAPNFLPMTSAGGTISDNYYTDVDNNLFNDIISGRLTVHNVTEAQTVVNKILLYERTPYLEDASWFTNACLIANEDYGSYPPVGNDTVYWNDIRLAKNHMLTNGYGTIDTFSYGLGNDKYDVINAVNNGRGFVLYRGSGLNNWSYPFDVAPDQTANGAKLPIVLSITCRTMSTSATPAAAEKWLLTGTPTTPRGGAGFFATTTTGIGFITFLRSAVCRGFFNALFLEDKHTFGGACEGGRRNVYALYSSTSEYRGFTTLGDPEMNIWTDTPCSLIVDHPQVVPVGNANLTVSVIQAATSLPVDRAIVCITAKADTALYAVDSTDASGNVYFSIQPQVMSDTLFVTVTGRNLQPYEGTMLTFSTGSYVVHHRSLIDDSIGGNNDGMINPGEYIVMPLWVRNCGDSTAHNVLGALRSSDSYVTITDSVKTFGNILPGDSAFTGDDGYDFEVAQNVHDEHILEFELSCRDINDSVWTSFFSKTVHAPDLVFLSAEISGGNNNSNFEPGETVTVVTTVRNEGSAAIDSVSARLRCLSAYVGVIDSTGTFSPMLPDSSASNNSDPFLVYSSESTPIGTNVLFELIVSRDYYCDTLEFSLCIGAVHYYIWNPDITPTPGQNMQNILDYLGYSGDYGTNLATDLNLYRSVWVCLGVYPNNYVIPSGSPEALALTEYAQNGGRVYMEGGDVWYYDPLGGGHDFRQLFGIDATADGAGDMGPVAGQPTTFTTGMNFGYGGENSFMDHISPLNANAFLIMRDGDNYYDCGVAYNQGTYCTVASSFELGLLNDGSPPSIRSALLDSIIHFFNITTGIEENTGLQDISGPVLNVFPNPFRGILHIECHMRAPDNEGQESEAAIHIYDVAGRLVRTIRPGKGEYTAHWDCNDDKGRKVSGGVYFVKLATEDKKNCTKVVLLK
ncbi:MAG: C25 family cysteine peptidase [candidate division WOR-3 bacterium]|nr:C25 family cysteine peptidase [candidate division WOR-3 bacterium]